MRPGRGDGHNCVAALEECKGALGPLVFFSMNQYELRHRCSGLKLPCNELHMSRSKNPTDPA